MTMPLQARPGVTPTVTPQLPGVPGAGISPLAGRIPVPGTGLPGQLPPGGNLDLNAILNSIASGPPPDVGGGISRVPVVPGTLPTITGPAPIPIDPSLYGPTIVPPPSSGGGGVPTHPGDTHTVVGGRDLGTVIPAAAGGNGNIIGVGDHAQVAGPRGDRTPVANLSVNDPNFNSIRRQQILEGFGLGDKAAGGGAGAVDPAHPYGGKGDGSQNAWNKPATTGTAAAAAPAAKNMGVNPGLNQNLAQQTGYTGGFAPGEFETWLASQPPATHAMVSNLTNQHQIMVGPVQANQQFPVGALMNQQPNQGLFAGGGGNR